jgi:hypothetical protein
MNGLETVGLTLGVALLGAAGVYGFYLWWQRVKADWDRYPFKTEEPRP